MEASLNTALLHAAPVVIVEDSDEDFDTLVEAALRAGVTQTVHRAATGGECLLLLRGEAGVCLPTLPALIVMDLNSHGVDGREALLAIKTDLILREIPVVVLTTSNNPKDVAFCYQAGANAYHVKPVRHDQYLLLLGSLLHYWLNSVTMHSATVKGN